MLGNRGDDTGDINFEPEDRTYQYPDDDVDIQNVPSQSFGSGEDIPHFENTNIRQDVKILYDKVMQALREMERKEGFQYLANLMSRVSKSISPLSSLIEGVNYGLGWANFLGITAGGYPGYDKVNQIFMGYLFPEVCMIGALNGMAEQHFVKRALWLQSMIRASGSSVNLTVFLTQFLMYVASDIASNPYDIPNGWAWTGIASAASVGLIQGANTYYRSRNEKNPLSITSMDNLDTALEVEEYFNQFYLPTVFAFIMGLTIRNVNTRKWYVNGLALLSLFALGVSAIESIESLDPAIKEELASFLSAIYPIWFLACLVIFNRRSIFTRIDSDYQDCCDFEEQETAFRIHEVSNEAWDEWAENLEEEIEAEVEKSHEKDEEIPLLSDKKTLTYSYDAKKKGHEDNNAINNLSEDLSQLKIGKKKTRYCCC